MATIVLCAVLAQAPLPTRINISQGFLEGVLDPRGMRAFRGIPYALPPEGPLRWREPKAHPGWTGVYNASQFKSPCMQPYKTTGCAGCGWPTVEYLQYQSEDCLFANIVAPAVASPTGELYPVILYIHAGEFHFGAATDRESDWPYFANDVLLVSFNFRLGPFGFMASEALRSRSPTRSTGNYGVLDQRLAMTWVRDNIAAFGGDPGRVTIMGESSGGTSVALHMVAPASWGLFQRAILESPGLTQTKELADAELNYQYILDALLSVGSPKCRRAEGYSIYTGARLYHDPLLVPPANLSSLEAAQTVCDSRADCAGLTLHDSGAKQAYVLYADAKIGDLRAQGVGANYTTYLKASSGDAAGVECLLAADAVVLTNYTAGQPRDDSFETDNFAPVLDGVEMSKSITDLIAEGRIAPNVDVLIGSNLDEGTVFMSLTPHLTCSASEADLSKWAQTFYGDALYADVLAAYQNLTTPIPQCGAKSAAEARRAEVDAVERERDAGARRQWAAAGLRHSQPPPMPPPSPPSSPPPSPLAAPPPPLGYQYMAAMRSAGDYTITCRVREAAKSLTHHQHANHSVFSYFFTHTPTYSANYEHLPSLGAFHGAEVPFAFSFPDELSNDAERQLASRMGCAWRNFAASGDPNVGPSPCLSGEAPVAWPRFVGGMEPHDQPTLIFDVNSTSVVYGLKDEQCDAFGLSSARAQAAPWPRQLRTGRK